MTQSSTHVQKMDFCATFEPCFVTTLKFLKNNDLVINYFYRLPFIERTKTIPDVSIL